MRRWRKLFVVLCALCLLGAQQAAYAHWIVHIGTAVSVAPAADGGDDDDDDAPPHVCTTCAAFAALNAAPPVVAPALAMGSVEAALFSEPVPAYTPASSAPPYIARAPPAVL
jgi:hypothetical protein